MDLNHIAGELVAQINCTYSNEAAAKLVLAALESVQSETRRAALREAADAVDNGAMRDNPASTIRALIAEPAPPDPLLVALAGLFADTWTVTPQDVLVSFGLMDERGGFTDLSKAALALAER